MSEPVDGILSADETGEMQGRNSSADFYRLRASHEALRDFEAEAIRCRDEAEERADAHASGRRKAEARELAALDVIRWLRDGRKPDLDAGLWWRSDLRVSWPMTDAEKRAMLDAAAGPDDPAGDEL